MLEVVKSLSDVRRFVTSSQAHFLPPSLTPSATNYEYTHFYHNKHVAIVHKEGNRCWGSGGGQGVVQSGGTPLVLRLARFRYPRSPHLHYCFHYLLPPLQQQWWMVDWVNPHLPLALILLRSLVETPNAIYVAMFMSQNGFNRGC